MTSSPVLCCTGLFAFLLLGASSFSFGQAAKLDRTWWQSATREERTGFVLAFYDCPASARRPRGYSSDDLLAYVSQAFASRRDSPSIPFLLKQAAQDLKPKSIPASGETYSEKHGWLDGEWWGDNTHGYAKEKIGYVEGYLACHSKVPKPQTVTHLITAVNSHYSESSHAHDKIAEVLEPLLGHQGGQL